MDQRLVGVVMTSFACVAWKLERLLQPLLGTFSEENARKTKSNICEASNDRKSDTQQDRTSDSGGLEAVDTPHG